MLNRNLLVQGAVFFSGFEQLEGYCSPDVCDGPVHQNQKESYQTAGVTAGSLGSLWQGHTDSLNIMGKGYDFCLRGTRLQGGAHLGLSTSAEVWAPPCLSPPRARVLLSHLCPTRCSLRPSRCRLDILLPCTVHFGVLLQAFKEMCRTSLELAMPKKHTPFAMSLVEAGSPFRLGFVCDLARDPTSAASLPRLRLRAPLPPPFTSKPQAYTHASVPQPSLVGLPCARREPPDHDQNFVRRRGRQG